MTTRTRRTPERPHDPTAVTFVGFVLSLAHTAAFHFGDVPDPVSGQPGTVNLAAAQQIIDILALLEQKTRGNLTAEERQLLEQLRLRAAHALRRGQQGRARPSPRASSSLDVDSRRRQRVA